MKEGSNARTRAGLLSQMARASARIPHAHLAIAQGVYYFLGGVWPVVSIGTFISFTGAKTDIWLVKTVGLLLIVIGVVQIVAGIRWRVSLEIFLLSIGVAFALATIEIIYVVKWTISPVYLLDFLVELMLGALWLSIYVRGFSNPEVCSLYEPTFAGSGPGEQE